MKRITALLLVFTIIFTLSGCMDSKIELEGAGEGAFAYMHVDGLGSEEERNAFIMFEFESLNYTEYQVAYISCTCRPQIENVGSVARVRIGNDGTVTLFEWDYWGDSIKGTPDHPIQHNEVEVMAEYVDTQILGKGLTDINGADALAGTTVTTDNVRRMIEGLYEYHNNRG